jgi:Tol biopolymer transport system component
LLGLSIGVAGVSHQQAGAAFPGTNGKIAYLHSTAEFWEPQLHVMNPDGSEQELISNGGSHYDPAWSPDGAKLAFGWAGASDIWVARADGSDRVQVTSGAAYDVSPAWSPDARQIAFERYVLPNWMETDIYVVDATGGTPVDLTNHPGADSQPSWSPDGSKIAFRSDRSPAGVYVMDADGSNPHLLAQAGFHPDWAPDGSRIVYVAISYEPPSGPASPTGSPPPPQPREHLWLVNPDGSNRHQLTYSPGTQDDPSWSPDGAQIAYHGYVGSWNQVWTFDVASGTKTQLTTGDSASFSPSWQPVVPPAPPPPPPPPPGGPPPPPGAPPPPPGAPPPPPGAPPPPPGDPPPPPPHGDWFCRVPRVIGLPLSQARTRIVRAHCKVKRVRKARSRRPRNVVIGQSPRAGTRFRLGYRAPVRLVVSRGRR